MYWFEIKLHCKAVYFTVVAVGYMPSILLFPSPVTRYSRWRHQMETFSALLAICAGNSPATGKFPAQRPVTRSFDVSMICVWINGWVNNRDAGDLRRHHTHYDVTVMHFPRLHGHTRSLACTQNYSLHTSMWWVKKMINCWFYFSRLHFDGP